MIAPSTAPSTAAIVTVGTELVRGLAVDTNTSEIARAISGAGVDVLEAVSVADDEDILAGHLTRCTALYDLVLVTGGLGPTHDDVTRQAAARALGLALHRDPLIEARLQPIAHRHTDPRAGLQVMAQADVIEGARIIPAERGTAPGQIVPTPRGMLVLMPGPPHEMRPMLDGVVTTLRGSAAEPEVVRCVGRPESELQLIAQDVLSGRSDIELTVLAKPSDVRVVLFDRGAGAEELRIVAGRIAAAVGDDCYSTDGSTLADATLARARSTGVTVATAESCTGGLVGGALTEVPGASRTYVGGVVSYSNDVKTSVLGVDPVLIDTFGAVSDVVAKSMAAGVAAVTGADFAVAVTGVAGPEGGTDSKPVGTVWFAVATPHGCEAEMRRFPGDRDAIRERAVVAALDLLRRALPLPG